MNPLSGSVQSVYGVLEASNAPTFPLINATVSEISSVLSFTIPIDNISFYLYTGLTFDFYIKWVPLIV